MKQLFARVEFPDAGDIYDRDRARNLDSEKHYEVESVNIGGFHTTFILKDFDIYFNSVNFEFYLKNGEDMVKHNIFSDPDYNHFLKSIYDPHHLLNSH